MRTSRCSSCGAVIIWAVSASGKRMPVDAAPVDGGNIVLKEYAHGTEMSAVVLDLFNRQEYEGAAKYVSHFSTCPDADSWRKK